MGCAVAEPTPRTGSDQAGLSQATWSRFPSAEPFPLPTIPTYVTGEPFPTDVTFADIDGDGDQDVLAAILGALPHCYLGVWTNDGSGNFTPRSVSHVGCSEDAFAVAATDWDLDGDVDVGLKVEYGVIPFRGDGTGNFEMGERFALSTQGGSLVFVDIDADGYPDALDVQGHYSDAFLNVYKNNRDGTFGRFQSGNWLANVAIATPAYANPVAARAADLNGDGRMDVVSDASGTDQLLVYWGTGSLAFSTSPTVLPVPGALGIDVADMDLDGDLDLVTASHEYGYVAVLYNEGDAFSDPVFSPSGYAPTSIRTADLNGDCYPDVSTITFDSSYVSISLSQGGPLAPAVNYSLGMLVYSSAAADIDGDRDLDLVSANKISYSHFDTIEGFLTATRNLGNGTFFAPRAYDAIPDVDSFAIGDFNADGVKDLTFGKSVLMSSSTGLDTYVEAYGTSGVGCGLNPCGAAAPDLNADGLSDLIENGESGPHSAYLSNGDGTFTRTWQRYPTANSLTLATGNLNGDGLVDFVDLESFTFHQVFLGQGVGTFQDPIRIDVAWAGGKGPAHLADLNGDGLDDILISNYAPSGGIAVELNQGNGTSYAESLHAVTGGAYGIDTADYDGDGDLDVAVTVCGAEYGWVGILRGDGTGAVGSPELHVAGRCPSSVDSGDFDDDGDIDIVATSRGVTIWEINLLENPGDGTFPTHRSLVSGWHPGQAIVDDFDQDGDPDIVTTNGGSYTATVFENRVVSPDPAHSDARVCDLCPYDSNKLTPGECGCGVADTDSDGDQDPDCRDGCPEDPSKTQPGPCGCGSSDTDGDSDGNPNCTDGCPADRLKTTPGACGCGVPDTDSDRDGVPNCNDECRSNPDRTVPGPCGCEECSDAGTTDGGMMPEPDAGVTPDPDGGATPDLDAGPTEDLDGGAIPDGGGDASGEGGSSGETGSGGTSATAGAGASGGRRSAGGAAGASFDGGAAGEPDAGGRRGVSASSKEAGGCGCSVPTSGGGRATWAVVSALVVAAWIRRRRQRKPIEVRIQQPSYT